MAANTRTLVTRRKAVRNIARITRTMELIATARFKKAMDRATEAEAFTRKIAELAADVSASAGDITHPLLAKRPNPKTALLLVIGSNRGLCGGYNSGILRESMARLRQYDAEGLTRVVELSGRRIITHMRYQQVVPEATYTQFEDKPTFAEVDVIAEKYLKLFTSGKVDRVEVAYQRFYSASRQAPVVETLLPLAGTTIETRQRGGTAQPAEPPKPVQYEFMPSAKEILEALLPESFKVRLFKAFLDAAVSEQIARRVTMKSATENAEQMIKSLTQQYNRARQARITKEIAEVIGGAEALQ
jgi:F-type H+-transporting ATPase subunit gamma